MSAALPTLREAILAGESQLAAAGIESARLDAELLLGHLLDVPHLQLWLAQGQQLTAAQNSKFAQLLERRAHREPLQHILGWTAFLGLELHVNRDVLVPRPETETLAQLAIDYLRQQPSPARALDWGTGSGCLALALAQAVPTAQIVALDRSPDALRIARANATAHRLADRVQFRLGNGFQALRDSGSTDPARVAFDLIVTNPPYIPSGELAELPPEVRDHDPRLALDGGDDGLHCFRGLAAEAQDWLKPGARLMTEFGDGQASAVTSLFVSKGWTVVGVEKDLSGRERILIVESRRS